VLWLFFFSFFFFWYLQGFGFAEFADQEKQLAALEGLDKKEVGFDFPSFRFSFLFWCARFDNGIHFRFVCSFFCACNDIYTQVNGRSLSLKIALTDDGHANDDDSAAKGENAKAEQKEE